MTSYSPLIYLYIRYTNTVCLPSDFVNMMSHEFLIEFLLLILFLLFYEPWFILTIFILQGYMSNVLIHKPTVGDASWACSEETDNMRGKTITLK